MASITDNCGYGSVVFTRQGIIGQLLGIRIFDYCLFLPKYVLCNEATPWRTVWGGRLCRVIRGYGPNGLDRAVHLAGIKQVYSHIHGTFVPVVGENDVVYWVDPRSALLHAIRRGYPEVVSVVWRIVDYGARVEFLGLTGSRAGGYSHRSSDVDLIVYDNEAEKMIRIFSGLGRTWDPAGKWDLGGVRAQPIVDLSWRRRVIRFNGYSIGVTWIGVPSKPLYHCPPLHRQTSPAYPIKVLSRRVRIPPGQLSALLYPPCVQTYEGDWIISYEYNVAGLLYWGGVFRLRGLASQDGSTIFLGLREEPGEVIMLA